MASAWAGTMLLIPRALVSADDAVDLPGGLGPQAAKKVARLGGQQPAKPVGLPERLHLEPGAEVGVELGVGGVDDVVEHSRDEDPSGRGVVAGGQHPHQLGHRVGPSATDHAGMGVDVGGAELERQGEEAAEADVHRRAFGGDPQGVGDEDRPDPPQLRGVLGQHRGEAGAADLLLQLPEEVEAERHPPSHRVGHREEAGQRRALVVGGSSPEVAVAVDAHPERLALPLRLVGRLDVEVVVDHHRGSIGRAEHSVDVGLAAGAPDLRRAAEVADEGHCLLGAALHHRSPVWLGAHRGQLHQRPQPLLEELAVPLRPRPRVVIHGLTLILPVEGECSRWILITVQVLLRS